MDGRSDGEVNEYKKALVEATILALFPFAVLQLPQNYASS